MSYVYVVPFVAVPHFLDILVYLVFFFFPPDCFLALKVSIEILSSTTSNLLMSPSKAFFISVHVFISGTSFWFFLSISMYLFALPVCFFMLSTLSIRVLYI